MTEADSINHLLLRIYSQSTNGMVFDLRPLGHQYGLNSFQSLSEESRDRITSDDDEIDSESDSPYNSNAIPNFIINSNVDNDGSHACDQKTRR
ncbi:hypothetical protein [Endozoicomonas sp. 4G]|uniref:hypothetical protein n=1 Tax=Endozoicomonas sp. 4G TaxID=2872754 RepID=UPI002078C450|nr:hypothetical protein [Endozoicomonas sp. 4G]